MFKHITPILIFLLPMMLHASATTASGPNAVYLPIALNGGPVCDIEPRDMTLQVVDPGIAFSVDLWPGCQPALAVFSVTYCDANGNVYTTFSMLADPGHVYNIPAVQQWLGVTRENLSVNISGLSYTVTPEMFNP